MMLQMKYKKLKNDEVDEDVFDDIKDDSNED